MSIIVVCECNYAHNYKLMGMIVCIIMLMLMLIARWNYSIIVVEPTIIVL